MNTTALSAPAVGDILGCGHPRPATEGIGTGYARDAGTDATLCYPCADAAERSVFRDATTFTAYVSAAGDLTTWTGGLLARGVCCTGGVSRAGWHGSAIYSWRFRANDGSEWYGRNGGPGMVITVRRARHAS